MLILLLLIPLFSFSQSITLSEKELLEITRSSSPGISEIRSRLYDRKKAYDQEKEKYAPELYAGGLYSETNERAIIEFIPVFSPVKQAFAGIRKKYQAGLETSLQVTTDQRSASAPLAGSFHNVTTNVLSFTVKIDLWKNLFGALTAAELKETHLSSRQAHIQQEIDRKILEYSVRRIFWGLVANYEQIKISERLLRDAEILLRDAQRRASKAVGDAGDVARYEALVAERKGQTIYFNYQREILLKNLKTLLPDLNEKEITITGVDIDKTINEVRECAGIITSKPDTPWDFTRYDEIVHFLKEVRSLRKDINSRHDRIDVSLTGTLKSTGIGSDDYGANHFRGNYGDAFRDMQTHNRSGYEIGLNVTIPLGDATKKTRTSKTIYDEERLDAQINGLNARIASTHSELSKSMRLIGEIIESQKLSRSALEKRLKVITRKYSEARVTLNDLLLDQNALLNSELSVVDAQLQALYVLFDYLTVFTDTPCTFNRI